ncbi:hypothetical protein [Caballeronia sp. 15711]|uniref:hypothetical protein n=1 Tax=Caballeronia sp. 15711 TaxID=3391029 RepID=UPI0039E3E128
MMLADVVPQQQLRDLFGQALTLEEFGKDDLSTIVKLKPGDIFATAGNVWNRIVTRGEMDVDPGRFGRHFDRKDPKLHKAISKLIEDDVIRDVQMARAWRGVPRNANLVMELLLVEVYPGELHLADVLLQHPDRLIAPLERRFTHQSHEGLGLLGVLVSNMECYAQSKGIEHLTLTAADADLIPLFQRHGFDVENSLAATIGLRAGMSIPMERAVTHDQGV